MSPSPYAAASSIIILTKPSPASPTPQPLCYKIITPSPPGSITNHKDDITPLEQPPPRDQLKRFSLYTIAWEPATSKPPRFPSITKPPSPPRLGPPKCHVHSHIQREGKGED